MPAAILFTDLDGTLLDHHTYEPATEAVERLRRAGVPIVFCSAKTIAEQRALADDLGLRPGMIAENGAVVELPAELCGTPVSHTFGLPRREVRRTIAKVAAELGGSVVGYGDLTPSEVATVTGLDVDAARRAMDRACTETIVDLDGVDPELLARGLEGRGLRLQRGARFWTVQGDHDKGRAVRWVLDRLRTDDLTSYAVGDAPNDREMLEAVERPMLVRRPDGTWAELGIPAVRHLPGIGPSGFTQAVEVILEEGS